MTIVRSNVDDQGNFSPIRFRESFLGASDRANGSSRSGHRAAFFPLFLLSIFAVHDRLGFGERLPARSRDRGSHSLLPKSWYYANGEIWFLNMQLTSLPFVHWPVRPYLQFGASIFLGAVFSARRSSSSSAAPARHAMPCCGVSWCSSPEARNTSRYFPAGPHLFDLPVRDAGDPRPGLPLPQGGKSVSGPAGGHGGRRLHQLSERTRES